MRARTRPLEADRSPRSTRPARPGKETVSTRRRFTISVRRDRAASDVRHAVQHLFLFIKFGSKAERRQPFRPGPSIRNRPSISINAADIRFACAGVRPASKDLRFVPVEPVRPCAAARLADRPATILAILLQTATRECDPFGTGRAAENVPDFGLGVCEDAVGLSGTDWLFLWE